MSVKSIPEGYHSVTPYLIVKGGADAIEFYKKAFGAVELFRMPSPDGKIGHAEIKVGDSPIMLADEYPDMGYKGPQSIGGSPVSLMIYVMTSTRFSVRRSTPGDCERSSGGQVLWRSNGDSDRSLRPQVAPGDA